MHLSTRLFFALIALRSAFGVTSPTTVRATPTHLVEQQPVIVQTIAPDAVLIDFGRVAFGNLRLTLPDGAHGSITVHFGEAQSEGRINRKPPGTVRYAVVPATLEGAPLIVAPPPDKRNAIALPGLQGVGRESTPPPPPDLAA